MVTRRTQTAAPTPTREEGRHVISTTWTQAPAGMPRAGLDVRPHAGRRAPEAFTAPFQGSGLPRGGAVLDSVAAAVLQRDTDNLHSDATTTTLGLHSSRRPPG